jgi:hypothetical protein
VILLKKLYELCSRGNVARDKYGTIVLVPSGDDIDVLSKSALTEELRRSVREEF